jgi:excisionase family DNA binding protein
VPNGPFAPAEAASILGRVELISSDEAARRLGVPILTLHRWINEGRIPAYSFVGDVKLKSVDVDILRALPQAG